MAYKGAILIVDDEAGPREALRIIFRPKYEIHTACNGLGALDCIRKESIDLIFLDLKMPGLSGYDLLEEIKKLNKRLEVIVITGLSMVPNARKAINNGAGGYISKPFDVANVISLVDKAFEKRNSLANQDHSSQQIQDLRP